MSDARVWTVRQELDLVFGVGALESLPDLIAHRPSVVVATPGAARRGLVDRVASLAGNVVGVYAEVVPNPTIDELDRAARAIATYGAEVLIAVGGGSAIDSAKVFSALLGDSHPSLREHVDLGTPLDLRSTVPVVAIPTTAGTGSEVTPFATVWDRSGARKHSVSDPRLTPVAAILDPQLTVSLPRTETVSSGLDAVSQALESLWNRASNAVSRSWASESLRLSVPSLGCAADFPEDLRYRAAMLEASLLAGLAISQTRTALAHSMSYPLTAHYGLPHGVACAFTLPAIVEFIAEERPAEVTEIAILAGVGDAASLAQVLIDLLVDVGATDIVRDHVPDATALLSLTHEMLTPGRADNTLRAPEIQDVSQILSRSVELLEIW